MNNQEDKIDGEYGDYIFNQKIKLGRLSLGKKIAVTIVLVVFFGMWFAYNALYVDEAQSTDEINFMVEKGESIEQLANRLKQENIIKSKWLFKKYLVFKGIDKKIQAGRFNVIYPITLSRVVNALQNVIGQDERIITIIPGWDMRDMAKYFLSQGLVESTNDFYKLVGVPATKYTSGAPQLDYNIELLEAKPKDISYEGYFAPNTYRIFEDATIDEVLKKLVLQQDKLITNKMREDIKNSKRSIHEILTMASIIEREVRESSEKKRVSGIFWKRYDNRWALQADSTVHYVTGREGDVFTTSDERNIDNQWNTYEYPGLPPGPISAPDFDSIYAAVYPEENNYWYFLTTLDGEVKYATNLDEHNNNVRKYLR
ncbi:MAG: hypothetical protein A2725_02675 [Candidatus Magasanikbacteria bacterium RIFCSPHIGHO2_01_FULL_33_34]|uniref:Endolytic murein transglycosylase n=1 Tax=Candidatus Magasanikbacteria bacterium RIFCSPHIGHO2_01_FULL_33_34 TaxID=1798671 RepID=A0A1F6LH25_9BACT|nr:MAG: hypothetical protein A2725_02675 [Candidatus Magasanikbacteria bacterium RIFCSPHIGHO2_01_FULL_33_34]OGH66042.1 MAG: hypothetical protein A3B83_00165 [Candidatus Magasanikbacteria bacterium RIFCSPHIGHO2_02_FULL_33_17]OGH75888.1 MAG: hypothetical protein A3A89_00075 [Candidatus Magasanikbacteria bacterium RIFCSPLOWO2_01_FULL_33_34]